jgi:cytoskeletal protein CcmA (bactofilin family)
MSASPAEATLSAPSTASGTTPSPPSNETPSTAPKRRFMEKNGGTPTFIGQGTVFAGDLTGQGQFVILGSVKGDGDIAGNLHIAAEASWYGHIRAENAIVAGQIEGSIMVYGKIEIGENAIIRGRVTARIVSIASGAIVDGEVIMTAAEPMRRFDEKREPR